MPSGETRRIASERAPEWIDAAARSRSLTRMVSPRCIAFVGLLAVACDPPLPPSPPAPLSPPPTVTGERIFAPVPQPLVCPAGSRLDEAGTRCIAVQPLAPAIAKEPPPEPDPGSAPLRGVRVRCRFAKGWAALLPARSVPRNDQFLMQSLIGLTEEPAFWMKQREYAALAPYAAHRCAASGATFDPGPGKYLLLVGEADTFAARGEYASNGLRRTIDITATGPAVDLDLRATDLKESFPCISCPYVAFVDAEGRELPAFVILPYRLGRERSGT